MKNIMKKDLQREITRNFSRFISIAILIALGITFFIGLKSTPTIMISKAEKFFVQKNYNDLSIFTSSAIKDEDIKQYKKDKNIKQIKKGYAYHFISDKNNVIELKSYEKGTYDIVKGRAPKKEKDILLDAKAMDHYKIGDTITLNDSNGEKPDTLKENKFKIVGFANYYEYLSRFVRGTSTIGNGEISYFATSVYSNFDEKEFNTLNVKLSDKIRDEGVFDSKYLETLDKETKKIEDITTEIVDNNKLENVDEINQKIDDANKEKDKLNQELENVNKKIDELDAAAKSNPYINVDKDKKELVDGKNDIDKTLKELDDSIGDLEKSRSDVDKIESKVTPIDDTPTFLIYKDNIQRLDILGSTIPFIFFFIATLITTTVLIRMINRDRANIGTLKAIGVKNKLITRKYLHYCLYILAIGVVLGFILGTIVFTKVLISLYSPMYIFEKYPIIISYHLLVISFCISFISVIVLPYLFYTNIIKETPLSLMRPKTTQHGKKFILERFPKLWSKLPFTFKIFMRNFMYYRYRMLLIFVGLVGCLSLVISGYGARLSVNSLQQKQFHELQKYNLTLKTDKSATKEDIKELEEALGKAKFIKNRQNTVKFKFKNKQDTNAILVSPYKQTKNNNLSDYFKIIDSNTMKPLKLSSKDVMITKKLADILGVSVGDKITFEMPDKTKVKLKVTHIVENYYEHYIFIGNDTYQKNMADDQSFDTYWSMYKPKNNKELEKLLALNATSVISTRKQAIQKMEEMITQLDTLIIVIIVSSVVLGGIVTYNLTYILILERQQEIAVLRAIGERPAKVSLHIFKELNLLLFFTVFFGSYTGLKLHGVIMKQIELEFLNFPSVNTMELLTLSNVTLIAMYVFILFMLHFKIKKTDVVVSLKARE